MKKRIPNEARVGFSINKAYEFLNEFKNLSLPINLYDLCAFHDITLKSYSDLSNHEDEFDLSVTDLDYKKLPKDGFALMYDNTPYILYNDKARYKRRIRFTIAHEIGHIILGHFDDFDLSVLHRDEIYTNQYDTLEEEANNFARNILTPFPFLKHIDLDEANQWKEYFHITEGAAKTRKLFINMDKKLVVREEKIKFKAKFQDLVTLPLNLKRCKQCKSILNLKSAHFCKYCGSNKITKTYPQIGDENLTYPGVEVDQNSKALKCPRCENEELAEGGYCQVCGCYVINKCSGYFDGEHDQNSPFNYRPNWHELDNKCDTLLGGEARFCHKCGSTSTYFEIELLVNWEQEKENGGKT